MGSAEKRTRKGDAGEEDVDIGEDIPIEDYPSVEIERDGTAVAVAASSGSSSSGSSSSSSGSSSSGIFYFNPFPKSPTSKGFHFIVYR